VPRVSSKSQPKFLKITKKKSYLTSEGIGDSKEKLKKSSDADKLISTAFTHEYWEIRREAVSQISDQSILHEIAVNDDIWQVRFASVEGLSDENILEQIVSSDPHEYVKKMAIDKISDQNILKKIVLEKKQENDIRQRAVNRMTNITMLSNLRPKVDYDIRPSLLERIQTLRKYSR
jgi:hypothetical protein